MSYAIKGSANVLFSTSTASGVPTHTAIGVVTSARDAISGKELEISDGEGGFHAVVLHGEIREIEIEGVFKNGGEPPTRGNAVTVGAGSFTCVGSEKLWEVDKEVKLRFTLKKWNGVTAS